MLFKRGTETSIPELLHLIKLHIVVGDIVGGGTVHLLAELSLKFGLHVVTAEDANQLQDVCLDLLSVPLGLILLSDALKDALLSLKVSHVEPIDIHVDVVEALLALSLRPEQTTSLSTEHGLYNANQN